MRNLKTLLLFCFLFLLCTIFGQQSLQKSIKIGTYSSYHFTLIERISLFTFKHINYFTNGAEIKLNNNNTFRYTTCGNIILGTWKEKNDSLFLYVESNRFRNDSLQKVGLNGTWPVITEEPIAFKIKRNKFIQISKATNEKLMITKLIFRE